MGRTHIFIVSYILLLMIIISKRCQKKKKENHERFFNVIPWINKRKIHISENKCSRSSKNKPINKLTTFRRRNTLWTCRSANFTRLGLISLLALEQKLVGNHRSIAIYSIEIPHKKFCFKRERILCTLPLRWHEQYTFI